jgi:hypothetical protein
MKCEGPPEKGLGYWSDMQCSKEVCCIIEGHGAKYQNKRGCPIWLGVIICAQWCNDVIRNHIRRYVVGVIDCIPSLLIININRMWESILISSHRCEKGLKYICHTSLICEVRGSDDHNHISVRCINRNHIYCPYACTIPKHLALRHRHFIRLAHIENYIIVTDID